MSTSFSITIKNGAESTFFNGYSVGYPTMILRVISRAMAGQEVLTMDAFGREYAKEYEGLPVEYQPSVEESPSELLGEWHYEVDHDRSTIRVATEIWGDSANQVKKDLILYEEDLMVMAWVNPLSYVRQLIVEYMAGELDEIIRAAKELRDLGLKVDMLEI